ncbi:MAG: CdaR family protein [Lachnospiraceae bacterium]|nr:CdaR family protein [Lachnospiraceae bacterium]
MDVRPTFLQRLKSLRLKENLGLKILALVISFVLWIVVVNITDPFGTITYKDVPVKFVNNNLSTNGKTLEILNNTEVIESVTVKAPRSVIRELGNSNDNIEAIADFNRMSMDETRVPIEFSVSKYADKVENIKATHTTLEVNVETRRYIQKPIMATISGEVSEGYVVGDISTAQNQVKISGPESIIERIDKAGVDVQVTGFTDNISTLSEVVLYDIDGNEISNKNLMLNIENLRVDVEILASKTVPVSFNVSGMPDENSALTGDLYTDVEEVTIAGKKATVDAIAAIIVPSSALNVSGLKSNLNVTIDVKDYLPAGIRLAPGDFDGKINVTVAIEEYKQETYSVYLKNVDMQSGPDGFDIDWAEKNDYVEFTLVGLARDLDKLKLDSLDYHVDFGDYSMANGIDTFKTGLYRLNLNLNLPEGIKLKEPVTIMVSLKKAKNS